MRRRGRSWLFGRSFLFSAAAAAVAMAVVVFFLFARQKREGFSLSLPSVLDGGDGEDKTSSSGKLERNVWILWLQGWEEAPWLQLQVVESWKKRNPGWKIHQVSLENLREYVNDIGYIYDTSKEIESAAKSDIIRLSLLKNHGGVWADSTMLCMQSLDDWVDKKVAPADVWMYRCANGASEGGVHPENPASWFIAAKRGSYIMGKWKDRCDQYWSQRSRMHTYLWLDSLFRELYGSDKKFRELWDTTEVIDADDPGQPHMLSVPIMFENKESLKRVLSTNPPYIVKLSSQWNKKCGTGTPQNDRCLISTGYYAIQLATLQSGGGGAGGGAQ